MSHEACMIKSLTIGSDRCTIEKRQILLPCEVTNPKQSTIVVDWTFHHIKVNVKWENRREGWNTITQACCRLQVLPSKHAKTKIYRHEGQHQQLRRRLDDH
jgi:hypothetical protein